VAAHPSALVTSGEALASLAHTPVAAVMDRSPLCVRDDLSIECLIDTLLERGVGSATVVDARGRLLGLISMTDLVRERLAMGDTEERTDGPAIRRVVGSEWAPGFHVAPLLGTLVRDVMVRHAITLPEHATIARAGSVMAYEGIHQIPVVSREGTVLGVVSALDLLRMLALADGYLVPPHARGPRREKAA